MPRATCHADARHDAAAIACRHAMLDYALLFSLCFMPHFSARCYLLPAASLRCRCHADTRKAHLMLRYAALPLLITDAA